MFALFTGDQYYPLGGWRDFCGMFSSQEDAMENGEFRIENGCDWYHVVDITKGAIVHTVSTKETD